MTWGVENASVVFGARTPLDNVTLRAAPSTVSIVVGGDGAGKSTLLRALVGLVRLNSGVCRRPAKKDIGYVPATAGLYVDLTVDENVAFSAAAYGLRGPELAKRSAALLERIGLSGARGRLVGHLSGGMRRKLAVGMALLHRPTMLVLDEPTTGVDPVSRAELWRLITGAAAGGSAVVVATTYVDEAHRASRVVLLEQGRSIATGAPADIVAAVPGALGVVASGEKPSETSWRWGSTWRVWAPTRDLPAGAEPLQPDFEDAVMIAALADERRLAVDDAAR
ncbi:MAG TPA: ABC transporter ATP-binding protein [Candidatus Acidoferrales bacterium]|nr:ABC transporter ATP-binding protein [Candidatus Acidoferrales bacterium]